MSLFDRLLSSSSFGRIVTMPSRLTNGHSGPTSKKRKRSELSSQTDTSRGTSAKPIGSSSLQKVRNRDKQVRGPSERKEDLEESGSDGTDDEEEGTASKQAEIMQMEQDISTSSKNYNNIVKLLECVEVSSCRNLS